MFSHIRRFALLAALAFTTSLAFADATADEAWKKVEAVMNNLKNPANPPKSDEEVMVFIKSGLTAFDSAHKEFLVAAPSDPRRWQAKLFEVQTFEA